MWLTVKMNLNEFDDTSMAVTLNSQVNTVTTLQQEALPHYEWHTLFLEGDNGGGLAVPMVRQPFL